MKTGSLFFVASLLGSAFATPLVERAACNADNCARALTGTANPEATRSARRADCSSFMACTVTPAATTVTRTVTSGTTVIIQPTGFGVGAAKRAEDTPATAVTSCPTALPAYANVCKGSTAFASACSCAGVTRSTSTAATPESTTTVTVTNFETIYPSTTPAAAATSTTTTAAAADCTAVPATLSGPRQPVTYKQYFAGSGVTLDEDNPGNDRNFPRIIRASYDGNLAKCDAVSQCVQYAAYVEFYSFDLHYLKNTTMWECKMYFHSNRQTRYWDVYDQNVGAAYGYSL